MNKLFILLLLISNSLMSQAIPTSSRSQSAFNKVSPQLVVDLQKHGLKLGSEIFIRIFKQEAELEVWVKKDKSFELFRSYPICTFGFGGLGPKLKEGDGKAPEGFYYVKANQLNPNSSYHLSFNLGYPNRFDRAHNRTGSALMVHGNCVSIGCYAMTDSKIEEIYTMANEAISQGQDFFRVHVFPFKMTKENMAKHQSSQWYNFWVNLKQGYDYFIANKFNPPNVDVQGLKYIFNPD